MIIEIWRYRDFIWGMVKREFRARYLGSILGGLWSIINPMAMIFVYTVIFSKIMRAKLPGVDDNMAYGVYLCAGLLPWNYFSEVIGRSQNMFIEAGNFLKKVSFPRSSIPLIAILSSTVNFAIIFGIFLLFLLVTGRFPGIVIIALIPLLGLQLAFAAGIGIILGTLNVFFRDFGQFMGVILQFWFWFTPIVYPLSIIPEWAINLLSLNPVFPLIISYQNLFLHHSWPQWTSLLPLALLSLLLMLVSFTIFRKLSGELVDEL